MEISITMENTSPPEKVINFPGKQDCGEEPCEPTQMTPEEEEAAMEAMRSEEREKFLNSLSPEEKEQYLKEEAKYKEIGNRNKKFFQDIADGNDENYSDRELMIGLILALTHSLGAVTSGIGTCSEQVNYLSEGVATSTENQAMISDAIGVIIKSQSELAEKLGFANRAQKRTIKANLDKKD